MIDVKEICSELYGLDVATRDLAGEQDINFRVTDEAGRDYVLKLSPGDSDIEVLELQNRVLLRLEKAENETENQGRFPRVLTSVNGLHVEKIRIDGKDYLVRLLTFLPGKPLAGVLPHSPELLRRLGIMLGRLDQSLDGMEDISAANRDFMWDIRQAADVIDQYIFSIQDMDRRELVEMITRRCLPILESCRECLPLALIHNDANDYNVMVDCGLPGDIRITGLIDFGDLAWTWRVAEPAISAFYLMLNKNDPVAAAAALVSGYDSVVQLSDEELAVFYPLMCLRGCASVCVSAYRTVRQPDNEYLRISEAPAWRFLEHALGIHPRLAEYRLREACGREPCGAASVLVPWLKKNTGSFSSPVPVDFKSSSQSVLDLGVGSRVWNSFPGLLSDETVEKGNGILFDSGRSVSKKLIESGVSHVLGRYGEARLAYPGKRYMQNTDSVPERKNIHLGIDTFLPPGTPVFAPLEGEVYSCSDNSRPLDYGPTVILRHSPEPGLQFFTLYGHLERAFLENLREGDKVEKGAQIGRVGDMNENGGWPPHLHFQVIADMLGHKRSFPGVSAPSQKDTWCSVSPDPNLLLGIPEEILEAGSRSAEEIVDYREHHLGKSLSVSYDKPLKIVRGKGQYLYDQEGRQFLDCVNNVCHVGHSHTEVVKAAMQQAFTLNTNTRYLHDCLVEYTESLLSRFPDPLDTCFLVCSGSEANELALRLARTYTGAYDVIAVDGAYHGNTQALIDISSYKHDGPGGRGAPDWAHIVPLPDGYRGKHKGKGADAGKAYAAYVKARLEELSAKGKKVSCFICESLPGCGGQIVLPDEYLKNVYSSTIKHGVVNIADEVQTGFGRVGTHFWGYQAQGVVPDIVTLGKPIGNGHPMAAVITTSEIADAFANGMEYFNTFGGNPVSCATGQAVLEIIDRERLQEHARDIGDFLMEKLRLLQEKHTLIGDVRGSGLFIGVELVRNRKSLEPAVPEADYIVNRMREKGILLSTDGPLHNVLKFKPPMVFSRENGEQLAEALGMAFSELESQAGS